MIDFPAIYAHRRIGDPQHHLAHDGSLDVDVVSDFLMFGQNLSGELDLTATQRTAAPQAAAPAEGKTAQR